MTVHASGGRCCACAAPSAASFSSFAPLFRLALLAPAAALLGPGGAASAADFASAVVFYEPGLGVPAAYQDPKAALGSPSRFEPSPFDTGVVTPFRAPFSPGLVTGIGPGGSLVLELAAPATDDPRHPFGIDLLVFGNSFFSDDEWPAGTCGVLFDEGGVIEVSADGRDWHVIRGVGADGLFPTLGYLDVGPYDAEPGTIESDFSKPVDPSITSLSLLGATWPELLAAYDGSGGGAGVDLASVGLANAAFVRITVPAGSGFTAEIDAVSLVAAPAGLPGDLDGNGVVNGADLGLLLASWGATGPDIPADLNGSGVVDGADLAVVLGHWSTP